MKLKVFLSYSHKDEKFKEELDEHLSSLKRGNVIEVWNDRKIISGTEWKDDIFDNLKEADLIICLLSSSFLASDFCIDKEFKFALERHKKNEAVIVPVVIRPCDWTPIMGNIQGAPKDGLAVTMWKNQDEAYMNIVTSIKDTINYIIDRKEEKAELIKKSHEIEISKIQGAFDKSICERPHKSRISGDLNHLPFGYQLWIFKKPATMMTYHPEDGPLIIKNQKWENNLHIGSEQTNTHQGEKFNLLLTLVTEERGKELTKYLYDQNIRQIWPGVHEMKAVKILDTFEVIRKDN